MCCVWQVRGCKRAIVLQGRIAIAIATLLPFPAIATVPPLALEISEPMERHSPTERPDPPVPTILETEPVALIDSGNPELSLSMDSSGLTDADSSGLSLQPHHCPSRFPGVDATNCEGRLAFRSQFSLGTGLFGATINQPVPGLDVTLPDSRFFSWQGQAQWVRILAADTVLLARLNTQLADRPLLSLEQFAVGGFGSVRGYRQDTVVADNGIFASLEFWLPMLRSRKTQTLIQLIPFLDVSKGWNSGGKPDPDPNTLASVGLGLQWRQSDKLSARLEWGIPLITIESRDRTLQEQGLYFSLQVNPF